MKILVTGAKGQLGKKIIDLMSENFDLILTDSDVMNIVNIEQIEAVISKEKPNYIIHCAAYTQVDRAEENIEICRKVNALGTKNVAEIAKKYDVKLIYISTDFVFDGKKKSAYNEDDDANPLSIYGLTKFEGEKFIRQISEKYYIVRVAWLFGELPEGHPGTNFVEVMLKLAREREFLTVVNDQIGSPTYTTDLANVFMKLIEKEPAYGTYHFSGNGACSWYDFAKEIFAQSEVQVDLRAVTSQEYVQKAKRPSYSYLNKNKIENALDTRIRPWQEMLSDYISKR